jgi:hypothetical protein
LVGLCVIHFSDLQSLSTNTSEERISRAKLRVSRFAAVDTITLVLLALWQVAIFLITLTGIDPQFSSAKTEAVQRFDTVVQGISGASPAQIEQAWEHLRRVTPQSPLLVVPNVEKQREELLKRAQSERVEAFNNLNQQAGAARFLLGRDLSRVLLVTLVYAWAFRAFVRGR